MTPDDLNRTDIYHPESFKEGIRVLLLMRRHKEGGSARTDRKATLKRITTSKAEFDEALTELRNLWQPELRIYSTINPRNIEKAIRIFKYRQLDADYFATADKQSFYLDLENRWISCLKDPKASASSLFLIDIDNEEPAKYHEELCAKVFADMHYLHDQYKTRNGYHLITVPFNPTRVSFQDALHKNALMLWSY